MCLKVDIFRRYRFFSELSIILYHVVVVVSSLIYRIIERGNAIPVFLYFYREYSDHETKEEVLKSLLLIIFSLMKTCRY